MTTFAMYLIKVSACLGFFYILYFSIFQKYTFFKANRCYLLLTLIVSFAIPLLNFSLLRVHNSIVRLDSIEEAFDEPLYFIKNFSPEQRLTPGINYLEIGYIIYFMGAAIMFFRLVFSIYTLIRIKNNSERHYEHKLKILQTELPQPFSFFNLIFLPKRAINPIIIAHEKAHVDQFHWIDLLLAEIACILLWFNPFAFFYKRSIKLQHEYLADSSTIEGGVEVQQYLKRMLIQLKAENGLGVVSQFYSQSIKKRIIMITKTKTSIKFSLAYALLIPVASVLLFAFSNKPIAPYSIDLQNTTNVEENIPSISPVEIAKVTSVSGYGNRRHPMTKKMQFHRGFDFELPKGEPIISPAAGTVMKSTQDSWLGNYVIVKHSNTYTTTYSHLESSIVNEGDILTKEQTIGYVGSTGISIGPHLHYEVIKDGQFVDPKNYFPKIDM